jgi:hypothetical protein
MMTNQKMPGRVAQLSKGSLRYLRENHRLTENYLIFLNKATTFNLMVLNDESTTKFIWNSMCTGPRSGRKNCIDILNRANKEPRLSDVFLTHIPIHEILNQIPNWKKEPDSLTEILKVLTVLGSKNDRKLCDKIMTHLSFVKELVNLLEYLPEDDVSKLKTPFVYPFPENSLSYSMISRSQIWIC